MMDQPMPSELVAAIGEETRDFVVKAKWETARSAAVALMLFGLFWTGFTSIFLAAIFLPILQGKPVHYTSNGTHMTATPGHLGPLIFPGIISGLFSLIGVAMLYGGVRALFAEGFWFVGTPTRLVIWGPKKFRTLDWRQFTGDIDVAGTPENGNVTLEMRTGSVSSSKSGSRYVPDKIYIVGIPNAMGIEEICRRRIKEAGLPS